MRAMWKAVVQVGDVKVPVKLYSALQDRNVHFRLLHDKDLAPVKQHLVNPQTDEVVQQESVRRGYFTPEGDLVMLNPEELDALEPEPSREIRVLSFLPAGVIDHRWYGRPYYLGPDESQGKYSALAHALAKTNCEGLARWVMRKKAYVGALRLHHGYPTLIALRNAEEVIALDAIDTPEGAELDERELSMAHQLIGMLASEFQPEEYSDHYRLRLLKLVKNKATGGKIAAFRPRAKAAATDDLRKALEASLQQQEKKRA